MHRKTNRTVLLGAAAAALSALLWGGWFPLSRLMVVDAALSPEDIAFLRFSLAGVCLLPVVMRHGLKAGRAGWRGTVLMTLTIGFPYPFLLASGLRYAPAAHSAIFVPGTFPVLTAILGVIVLKDPVRWRSVAGTALVMIGVGSVGWNALVTGEAGAWQGYALFMACAWMFSIYSIAARISGIGALHCVAIISVLSAVVFVPPYLLFGEVRVFELSWPALFFQIAYQGIGVGLVALIGYNYAINALGAAQAAVFGGLVPCVAALSAVPILGEPLTPVDILGIAAVTAGVLLVNGARLPALRRPAAAQSR